MIQADVTWNKKSIRNYVLYTMFLRTKGRKAMTISLIACTAVILLAGIISYIIIQMPAVLIMTSIAIGCILMYAVILLTVVGSYVSKAVKSDDNAQNIAYIDGSGISLYRNTDYVGKVGWDKLKDSILTKNACYLTLESDALFIVEYSTISQGTKEELIELVKNHTK